MPSSHSETSDDAARPVIQRTLPCTVCGYDLRGLPIQATCPECGSAVRATLRNTIDPQAGKHPELRSPRRVGDGLLITVVAISAAFVLSIAQFLTYRVAQLTDSLGGAGGFVSWTPSWFRHVAIGLLLVVLFVAIPRFAPPRSAPAERDPRVGRGLHLIRIASIIWILVLATLALDGSLYRLPADELVRETVTLILVMVPMTAALFGLEKLLDVIGDRSRQYRRSGSSRQRCRDMIWAVAAALAGQIVAIVATATELEFAANVGSLVVWTSVFMIVVGLGYLIVNAIWIRSALVAPPPTLRELVTPPLVIADEEDPDAPATSADETAERESD